jgi:hypothetical protein
VICTAALAARLPDRKARDAELNKAIAFLVDALEQMRQVSHLKLLMLSDLSYQEKTVHI